jgi:hypothetical protein
MTDVWDDAIRAMLEHRVERLATVPVDPVSFVRGAVTRPVVAGRWWPRPALGLASSVALVVVIAGALALGPLRVQVPASAPPTLGPSTTVPSTSSTSSTESGPPVEAASLRVITPAELVALATTRGELAGRLAMVSGPLSVRLDPRYLGRPGPTATFPDAPAGVVLRLDEAFRAVLRDGVGDFDGVFLVRFTSASEGRNPIVDVLGRLTSATSDQPTIRVGDLLDLPSGEVGAVAAVDGWLVRSPVHPCPTFATSTPAPTDVPTYGCPDDEYLTDEVFQPLRADGSVVGPAEAINLPVGSYDRWAPDPLVVPGGGVAPRRATYVVQRVAPICPPDTFCRLILPWQRATIVGRLDPLPLVGEPSATPAAARTVGEALTSPPTSGEVVVRGWLVATPPLRCRELPLPSGLPDYRCGELDYLTDEPFQPWTPFGGGGHVRAPEVGMRVQNGAYWAFAPDHTTIIGGGGALAPRLGTFRVRYAVHSTCEYGGGPVQECLGGPLPTWEILERLPDG